MNKKEIYRFIKGVRRKGLIIKLSLPLAVYILYRLWYRFIHHRIGLRINKAVLTILLLVFAAALVLIIINIIDMIRLRRDLSKIPENELCNDFKLGRRFLDGDVVIGERFIFSKGSSRLFVISDMSGVFDDIRETYNIVTMILAGSDDIVKTKIIKAEYRGKSFIYDRRICAVKVHNIYMSDVGQTNGYEQIEAIKNEISGKLGSDRIWI